MPIEHFDKINGIENHMKNVFQHFDKHMQAMNKHFEEA